MKRRFLVLCMVGCLSFGLLTGCGSGEGRGTELDWNARADVGDSDSSDFDAGGADPAEAGSPDFVLDDGLVGIMQDLKDYVSSAEFRDAGPDGRQNLLAVKLEELADEGIIMGDYAYDKESNGYVFTPFVADGRSYVVSEAGVFLDE